MTPAPANQAMVGAWDARLRFIEGPRKGEEEPVLLTFRPDGVVIHADRIPAGSGQLPRGIGEWAADGERFLYWFNVVLNQRSGQPDRVIYVHAEGTLAGGRRTFAARGGSEVYSGTGRRLATNRVDVLATRAEAE